MTTTTTVTCNTCGKDLTAVNSGYSHHVRIEVRAKGIPNTNRGAMFSMMEYPAPWEEGGDFCSIPCLTLWAAEHAPLLPTTTSGSHD